MPAYYPVNIDVRDKKCVVIGGGHEGEIKVLRLVEYGAIVKIVSTEVNDPVRDLVDGDRVTWIQRDYQNGDLEGVFIAIASVPDGPEAREIAKEAEERNVLLNVVDVTYLCTFIFPAVVRQGDVVASVSTGGASPALARKFRELLSGSKIESKHGLMEYAELAPLLGDARQEVRSTPEGLKLKSDHWQACITDRLVDLVQEDRYDEARKILMIDLNEGMNCDCENGTCRIWEEKKAAAESSSQRQRTSA